MIFVERTYLDAPAWFKSQKAISIKSEISNFYSNNSTELLAQRSLKENQNYSRMLNQFPRMPEIRSELKWLFKNKCAFCESSFSELYVAHFRPKSLYEWLAFEWENLVLCCRDCNKAQGGSFPVNGIRGEVLCSIEKLRKIEDYLLIDPCYDLPEKHISFNYIGEILSLTDKGEETIRTFELNRPSLVRGRKMRINEVENIITRLRENFEINPTQAIFNELSLKIYQIINSPDQPFQGSVRAVFEKELDKLRRKLKDEEVQGNSNTIGKHVNHLTKIRKISSIRVENLLDMEDCEIQLNEADGSNWLMILGENGTGKSTLLKLLAINLAGEEKRRYLRQGRLSPKELVKPGYSSGYIQIVFTGEPVITRKLIFNLDETWAGSADQPFDGNVLSYGPVRIVMKELNYDDIIQNQFNSYSCLLDMNMWLVEKYEADMSTYSAAVRCIRAMLPLEAAVAQNFLLEPDGSRLVFRNLHHEQNKIPLDSLSSGYRNVFSLVCDIFRKIDGKDESSLEGIVLLDEIDVHLHPRWKMRIVGQLKELFPSVQFITTAHDPLCLRGLNKQEIIVLNRIGNGVRVHSDNLPNPEGLRADQLLTSEFFGLSSTLDPETESIFTEYYSLLAKRERGSEDTKRIEEFKEILKQWGYMGNNHREQLMYRAIDLFLAEERILSTSELRQHAQDNNLMDKLRNIWNNKE
ncbi:TIGR02646 family protein [Paenibacillus sp. 19GGS1-52]|uniref:retron system putative HNH endonuclease n=1 Tax=Paenibacillus sp. 19GGS1-52 TaxID=2758563 RepID=UPI001EFC07A5|nr:retron system putative HNH endonuclease [Paenibacillus sp. 19GGS1-52]ULO04733.1 TIGR02646 family protein [Paenibacillus sp. 19GGS1-52]